MDCSKTENPYSETTGNAVETMLGMLIEQGYANAAKGIVPTLVARYPDNWRVRWACGRLFAKQRDYESAIHLYRQWTVDQPDDARGWFQLALILRDSEADPAEIAACYEHALALDPANAGYWLNLGVAYGDSGDLAKAIAAFDKAIALEPDYLSPRFAAAWTYIEFGRIESVTEMIDSLPPIIASVNANRSEEEAEWMTDWSNDLESLSKPV